MSGLDGYPGLFEAIADAIRSDPHQKTRMRGSEMSCRCVFPGHEDKNASAGFNVESGVYFCHVCKPTGREAGALHVASLLGIHAERYKQNGSASATPPGPTRRLIRETEYPYESLNGDATATKHRKDYSDGTKGCWWAPTGTKPNDLSFYGLGRLLASDEAENDGSELRCCIVVEGEKCADAAWAAGLPCIGTPSASYAPTDEVLRALLGWIVWLWPDNDAAGLKMMRQIQARLEAIGVTVVVLRWKNAPPKGDVADFLNAHPDIEGQDLIELLQTELKDITSVADADATTAEPPRRHIELIRADHIQVRPVEFLYEPYLAIGKVAILEGDPGLGKSTFLCCLTGAITRGGAMPCGDVHRDFEPTDVLLWMPEDDPEDTTVPRLKRASADLARVHFLGNEVFDGRATVATLEKSLALVEDRLKERHYSLLVIDTITSCLGAGISVNHSNEIGEVIANLKRIAHEYRTAIVLTRHLNKQKSGSAINDGTGSIAISGIARSVLQMAAKDEEKSEIGIFHIKCSYALEGPSIAFEIDSSGTVHWLTRASFSLAEAAHRGGDGPGRPRKVEDCAEWLAERVANEPVLSVVIYEEAAQEDWSERTVARARHVARVRTQQSGGAHYHLPAPPPPEP